MMDNAREVARRRSPRLTLRLDGRLTGRSPREVTVVDLSQTGCLARCPAQLDHGAIFDLDLAIDDGPLLVKVRVTEACLDGESLPDAAPHFLTGLEFLGLAPKDAVRLRRFLDEERRKRSADAPAH
jgi:PilZ domain